MHAAGAVGNCSHVRWKQTLTLSWHDVNDDLRLTSHQLIFEFSTVTVAVNTRCIHRWMPKILLCIKHFDDCCPKNYQSNRIVHDFCPKIPEFYIMIARKIFSRFFFLGGGAYAPSAPRLLRLCSYTTIFFLFSSAICLEKCYQQNYNGVTINPVVSTAMKSLM